MKGTQTPVSVIFLLAALILLARPFMIYSSPVLQASLAHEIRSFGYLKSVRKRREQINLMEVVMENERRVWQLPALAFAMMLAKKWVRIIVSFLSVIFSALYYLRRRRSIFEVSTQEEYLLALSVLRI